MTRTSLSPGLYPRREPLSAYTGVTSADTVIVETSSMLAQFVKRDLAHGDAYLSAGVLSFLSEVMLTLSSQSHVFVEIQTATGALCGFGRRDGGLCMLFRRFCRLIWCCFFLGEEAKW